MNKKILVVGLITVLAVSIGITTVIYFQKQSNQEAQEVNTYTIEGTLCYAPVNAILTGISATSITPSVSPWLSNITSTIPFPSPENSINTTVSSFILLEFSTKFNLPQEGGLFPAGFEQGDVVKISGQLSYSTPTYYYNFTWVGAPVYVMNVTSITHIYS